MVTSKGSYGHGESKNVLSLSVQIPSLPLCGSKIPRFMGGSIGPRMEICKTSTRWYGVCTKAMVISKGSYGYRESKNVLFLSVQIPSLPLRGSKIPRFMGGNIRPRMEICETSALPIPMVPRLHQSNGYIIRKLRALRIQKCIALVGVDTVLTTAWPQTTPFHGGYRAQNGNMRKLGPTYPHGTALTPK